AISPAPPAGPRLLLQPDDAGPAPLDGGWWPRSADAVAELPGLILALDKRHGRTSRVMLGAADRNASRPSRLRVGEADRHVLRRKPGAPSSAPGNGRAASLRDHETAPDHSRPVSAGHSRAADPRWKR